MYSSALTKIKHGTLSICGNRAFGSEPPFEYVFHFTVRFILKIIEDGPIVQMV